jgi:serine O-acetyltransferase
MPKIRLLIQDLNRNVVGTEGLARGRASVLKVIFTARFISVLLFRLSQEIGRVSPILAGMVKQLNQFMTGSDLAFQSQVGEGLILYHPNGVVIGPHCVLGANCSIQQGVTIGGSGVPGEGQETSPTIGDDVRIGAGAKILGPISVGDRCQIGANAVVTKSGGHGMIAVGVPAVWKQPSHEVRE